MDIRYVQDIVYLEITSLARLQSNSTYLVEFARNVDVSFEGLVACRQYNGPRRTHRHLFKVFRVQRSGRRRRLAPPLKPAK